MALTFILLKRAISDVFIPCWNSTVLFGLNWTKRPARGALSNNRSTWRGKAGLFLSRLFLNSKLNQHLSCFQHRPFGKIDKTPKTYLTYNWLQFPAEMNTRGSKTPTTSFLTNYYNRGRLLLNNILFLHSSLHDTMIWPQCMIYHSAWFINE